MTTVKKQLFQIDKEYYKAGSPLLLMSQKLVSSARDGSRSARLCWRNLEENAVTAAMVELRCFDNFGQELKPVVFHYDRFSSEQNAVFGEKVLIPLPDSNTARFQVFLRAVAFEDRPVWKSDANEPLELVRPEGDHGLVQCQCGSWNKEGAPCGACAAKAAKGKLLKWVIPAAAALVAAVALICVLTLSGGNSRKLTPERTTAAIIFDYWAALTEDGRYIDSAGWDLFNGCSDLVSLSMNPDELHVVALKKDGTVLAFDRDNDYGECNVEHFKNITTVYAGGDFTLGLNKDGDLVHTLEYTGFFSDEELAYLNKQWKGLKKLSYNNYIILGLKKDGTVIVCDIGSSTETITLDWENIVDVYAGPNYVCGIKKDGTVVTYPESTDSPAKGLDIKEWKNIVKVFPGECHVVGLCADGTVVAWGDNEEDQCNLYHWTDVVSVCPGYDFTLGLKKDGTVLFAGDEDDEIAAVRDWEDIVYLTFYDDVALGLKKDGTLVSTDESYQSDFEELDEKIMLP